MFRGVYGRIREEISTFRGVYGRPSNILARLFLITIVLVPSSYVSYVVSPNRLYGIVMILVYICFAASILFVSTSYGLLFFLIIALLQPIITSFTTSDLVSSSWYVLSILINGWIVVGLGKTILGVRAFVQVKPYFQIMVPPVVGFFISYLGIIVWFTIIHFFIYQMDRGAFSGIEGFAHAGALFWKFLYFSLGTILPASADSGIKPASLLAKICVSAETLIGTLWLVVVFAGVLGYLTPRFDKFAKTAERQSNERQTLIEQLSNELDEHIKQLSDKRNTLSEAMLAEALFNRRLDEINEMQKRHSDEVDILVKRQPDNIDMLTTYKIGLIKVLERRPVLRETLYPSGAPPSTKRSSASASPPSSIPTKKSIYSRQNRARSHRSKHSR